jgi:hypothetical protein
MRKTNRPYIFLRVIAPLRTNSDPSALDVPFRMTHFSNTQWVDFARGIYATDQHASMQKHLDSGCQACVSTFKLFQKLATGGAAQEIAVPAAVVHRARAIYSAYQPVRLPITTLIANLLFDSWSTPLAAGVRTARSVARQTAYEAGPYLIDLRIERERGNVRTQMTGQIADCRDPQASMNGIPVSLFADDELLASAHSSRFGEFQFDFLFTRGEVTLYLEPKGNAQRVELSLCDFDATDTRQDRNFDAPDRPGAV